MDNNPTRADLVPAREVERTGDDTPAASVYGYVWRMSGWHQLPVCVLAGVVAALSMAPLKLQRRIVNNAVGAADLRLLYWLGGIYAGVVVPERTDLRVLGPEHGLPALPAVEIVLVRTRGARARPSPAWHGT